MFSFDDRTRALLAAIARAGSISGAARAVGLDASNARRHLARAQERAGARLVRSERGGPFRGRTLLTAAGLRLAGIGGGILARAGEYDEERGVTPLAVGARELYAAGRVAPGAVEIRIPPEHVILARAASSTSARNSIAARVAETLVEKEGVHRVRLVAGALRFDALVTREALRELRLRGGSSVLASVKATAIEVRSLVA